MHPVRHHGATSGEVTEYLLPLNCRLWTRAALVSLKRRTILVMGSVNGVCSWHMKTSLQAPLVDGGTMNVKPSPGFNSSRRPIQSRSARLDLPVSGVRAHAPALDCSNASGTQAMCAPVPLL